MPVVSGTSASVGLGGMNAFSLRELVKRRVPKYDDTEYLSELNAAYKEVWEEIMQLDELFFSDIRVVTTQFQTDTFDLRSNLNNALDNPVPRLHQINRIRVQQPGGNLAASGWYAASPRHPNDPDYLASQQQLNPPPLVTPPYLYVVYGEGTVIFSRPLPAGALIEVWYTFALMDLQILTLGTITNTGLNVVGTGTFFTQLMPPDNLGDLPIATTTQESRIEAELITGGLTWRVMQVTDDTHLITLNTIIPAASGASYILASVPEFPGYEHRVVADLATRNMLSTPADDDRFQEWSAISAVSIGRMKNTFMRRQRQENAKRGRFPYGTVRRARFFGAR